jgi:hypothetical protein
MLNCLPFILLLPGPSAFMIRTGVIILCVDACTSRTEGPA